MDEDISYDEAQAQIDYWSREVDSLQQELNEFPEGSAEWYCVQAELSEAEAELGFYESLY